MKIVLCGYMGAGKSEVGKLLANDLEISFLDLDAEIEKNEGKKITEIFSEKGEIFFRKKENEVLKKIISEENELVFSLGGGTPCYANNLEILKKTPNLCLIYLKVDLQTLTNRLFKKKEKRPLIASIAKKEDLEDYLRKHLFERQYYYLQSDYTIDTSQKSIVETVKAIKELLD